jgi:hypothetical protein
MNNRTLRENLINIVQGYADNIHDYNHNMQDILRMFNRLLNTPVENENISYDTSLNTFINNRPNIYNHTHTPNRNSYHLRVSNLRRPSNTIINRTDVMDQINNLEDVIIRPTNAEIEVATELFNWSDRLSQTCCPIMLDIFNQGDAVRRIRYCRHVFQNNALMSWFERNTRCPVCRYDIRETMNTSEINNTEINNTEINNTQNSDTSSDATSVDDETYIYDIPPPTNFRPRNLSTFFQNLITNELNRTMPIMNDSSFNDVLFYSLNIPIEMDISYSNY